ncbi:multidrug transporter MATE [Pseudothermotoga hypogea DSM 11164 = NBRC 106472]|uniref:Multidrug-efflux transporter n=1 Tax=Pseudothermotoga hypogea DSM 11164 = NBRC 106472 TaxID=1123384 RepID=A0A0X1KQM8_9THEM|nr:MULTISPECIES: MATE family efflux transporter [Pseudothermotoga]AJC73484.1 multidrug transporter MATE [Pseudothermotoga hypogea DSM 11164 = NBRC 106472]MBC7122871.1 MATE family efflux transporter [Pseudothermotoga sp.]MDI6863250.1 MATE family efflux transporter [Pseudothermotoga sp.]
MPRDLTEGSLSKNLLYMAVPTMGGFAVQVLYDIVDMFWIGKISSRAIAGVAVFSSIFWLISVLNEIIGTGSVSMISQAYGAKDYARVNRTIEQTIVFKIFVALIATILLILFLKPLMMFFSKDEEVIAAGIDYGFWRIFFLPIFFATYSIYTALRTTGESKLPNIMMAVGAVTNMVLDPIFMFTRVPGLNIRGLGLGVKGAAIATVVASSVVFVWGLIVLFRGQGVIKITPAGLFKLDWSIDKKLLVVGLPSGIEMFLRNLSNMIMVKLFSMYGSTVLAAIGIVDRMIGLAFVPLMGFSIGTSTIVGQCLGANKIERAEQTVLLAALYNALFLSALVVLANISPQLVIEFFTKDQAVVREGAFAIRLGSWAVLIAGFSISLMSAFFGAGYTKAAMFSSIVGRWFVQVPYSVLVALVLKLPIKFLWFSFLFAEIGEISYASAVFFKGKWKSYRVI